MKNNTNSYNKIVSLMQQQGTKYNPPAIAIAEVIAPLPNLQIKLNDIPIDKDNILLDERLLDEYKRNFKIVNGQNFYIPKQTINITKKTEVPTHGFHTHEVTGIDASKHQSNGEIIKLRILNKGDKVAVMPTYDGQMFIVLAKVVSIK